MGLGELVDARLVTLSFSPIGNSNLAIWSHSVNGTTTQIGHLLFLEKFEQTKILDLRALPEIWKSRATEILSKKWFQTRSNDATWPPASSHALQISLGFDRPESAVVAAQWSRVSLRNNNSCGSGFNSCQVRGFFFFFVFSFLLHFPIRRCSSTHNKGKEKSITPPVLLESK